MTLSESMIGGALGRYKIVHKLFCPLLERYESHGG
jgi:hypothetical protein